MAHLKGINIAVTRLENLAATSPTVEIEVALYCVNLPVDRQENGLQEAIAVLQHATIQLMARADAVKNGTAPCADLTVVHGKPITTPTVPGRS